MLKEDIEEGKIPVEDLPYTFQSKSKILQIIFYLIPWLVWALVLIISLFMLDRTHSVYQNFSEMGNYTLQLFQTMFSDKTHRIELISITEKLLIGKSIVLFSFIPIGIFMLSFSTIHSIISFYNNEKNNKIAEYINYIFMLIICYFYFWKFPSFFFSLPLMEIFYRLHHL